MTVLELLIAMMIMLIITVPLVASFVVGVQTGVGSQQDVTNSADAQLVTYYFDIDVASTETVAPSSACGGSGAVLELRWTDGGTTRVSYRAIADEARRLALGLPVATSVYRLERVRCTGSGSPQSTTLARTLTALPDVTCDGSDCTDGQRPRRISMVLEELSTQQSDKTAPDTFTFGVTATRRVNP